MNSHLSQQPAQARFPMFVLIFVASLLGAMVAPDLNAKETQAAGIVIYKSVPPDTPQYYNGAIFKTVKDTGAWLTFDVGQDRPIHIEKGLIINVIEFDIAGTGNVLTTNILNDSDAQRIAAFSDHLKALTASMPKLANIVKSTTSLLQNQLSLYKSGNIKKDGRWFDKLTWERELAEKMKSSLIFAGKTYFNARLMSSKDDTVTLSHDGGIARIPLKDLDQKERLLLASTFKVNPAAFEPAKASPSEPVKPPQPPTMAGDPNAPGLPDPFATSTYRPKPLPSLPTKPQGPRIPVLPAVMKVESIGGGSSEREAIRDAQFNAVAATLEEHVTKDLGDWSSKITIVRIGDDSTRAADAYRKIAMKSGAGSVRVIIETSIAREKLVTLLLKLGFVE